MILFLALSSFFFHSHVISGSAKAENLNSMREKGVLEREGLGVFFPEDWQALFDILFLKQKFQVPCDFIINTPRVHA